MQGPLSDLDNLDELYRFSIENSLRWASLQLAKGQLNPTCYPLEYRSGHDMIRYTLITKFFVKKGRPWFI